MCCGSESGQERGERAPRLTGWEERGPGRILICEDHTALRSAEQKVRSRSQRGVTVATTLVDTIDEDHTPCLINLRRPASEQTRAPPFARSWRSESHRFLKPPRVAAPGPAAAPGRCPWVPAGFRRRGAVSDLGSLLAAWGNMLQSMI